MMKQNFKPRSLDKNKKTADGELYQRVRQILKSARTGVARTVNTTQVVANWLIGREIVEEEQQGAKRAEYGEELIRDLAQRLTREFGAGYSLDNLFWFRRFYRDYPEFLNGTIFDALRQISKPPAIFDAVRQISDATRRKSEKSHPARSHSRKPAAISNGVRSEVEIRHTRCGETWQPGQLHTNLSWTHYRTLLRVEKPEARSFYEIEAIQNNWSARELERQINSLLYERLALSRDKKGLLRLAQKGQEIQGPLDVFKDPMVLEFLNSRYKLHLPSEAELKAELLRELKRIGPAVSALPRYAAKKIKR
jgi:predicted nuclease of restriction endonuclease-like (RecB) superfamily